MEIKFIFVIIIINQLYFRTGSYRIKYVFYRNEKLVVVEYSRIYTFGLNVWGGGGNIKK